MVAIFPGAPCTGEHSRDFVKPKIGSTQIPAQTGVVTNDLVCVLCIRVEMPRWQLKVQGDNALILQPQPTVWLAVFSIYGHCSKCVIAYSCAVTHFCPSFALFRILNLTQR